jgi:DNA-binding CsgD family transcriptional regulator
MRVLCKVADGYKHKQVARQLHIEVTTITAHLRHIWDKLGCKNAASMVTMALKKRVIRLLTVLLMLVQFGHGLAPDTDMLRPVRAKTRLTRVVRLRKREDV